MEKKDAAKTIGCTAEDIAKAVAILRESLTGTGLSILEADETLELRTSADAAETVQRFRENRLSKDLGKAGLETLAAIAYRAASTRSEIDWIRGVNSSASLRTLLMRGLVEGKEDSSDKRKIRYSITTEALAHLGVTRIEELPRFNELSVEAEKAVEAGRAVNEEAPSAP